MDTKAKILDIAMNLNRIGNWAADGYGKKEKRIKLFLDQTNEFINSIAPSTLPITFQSTYTQFLDQFKTLNTTNPADTLLWAEKMMTWGNILTHRAKLLKE